MSLLSRDFKLISGGNNLSLSILQTDDLFGIKCPTILQQIVCEFLTLLFTKLGLRVI